jgi:hypothetical protein
VRGRSVWPKAGQLRGDPAAQAYVARRLREGKTTREALRALKRFLARAIWRRWEACLASVTPRAEAVAAEGEPSRPSSLHLVLIPRQCRRSRPAPTGRSLTLTGGTPVLASTRGETSASPSSRTWQVGLDRGVLDAPVAHP